MTDIQKKPIVTDPENSMKVRFTDNSPKEGDFYPKDQSPKPLILGPSGAPYSEWEELESYEIGQNERTDEIAADDHKMFAASEKLCRYLKEQPYADGE